MRLYFLFLGNVQMEVICAILEEKYHVEAEIKEPTVIYMERPLRKAEIYHPHRSPAKSFLGFCRVVHRAAPYWKRSAV